MARPERFELPTNWFEASYSIQLSYGRVEEGGLYRFLASEEGLRRQYSLHAPNFSVFSLHRPPAVPFFSAVAR